MAQQSTVAHDPRFDPKTYVCITKRCHDYKHLQPGCCDAYSTPRCPRCGEFMMLASERDS